MRRRSVLLMASVGLAVIIAGSAPWTLADQRAARQLTRHIGAMTGASLSYDGDVTVALLPAPRIKIDNVRLTGVDGRLLASARQFRGQLQVAPLLWGRLALSDVTLIEPAFRGPAPGARLEDVWSSATNALAALHRRASAGEPTPRRVTLVAGALLHADGKPGALGDINASITWPSADAGISLSGAAAIAGEPVQLELAGLAPRAMAGDGGADIILRLTSAPLRGELRGALSDGGRRLDGRTSLATTDLARLNSWLGLHLPAASRVSATLDAVCAINSRGVALSSASLKLGDSAFEGALALRPGDDGGWAVGGTLAADTLDMRNLSLTDWGADQPLLSQEALRRWDIDLRLSAATVRLGPDWRATDVAASVLARNGRLEAVLGAASTLGGMVKGRVALSPGLAGFDIKGQLSADQIDMTQAPALQDGPLRLKGALGGTAFLETSGRDRTELLMRLQGHGQLQVSDGEISGVNIADALRNASQRRAQEVLRLRGRTSFTSLRAIWSLAPGGAVWVDDISTQAAGAAPTLTMLGDIKVLDGALAMTGSVRAGGNDPGRSKFRLSGSWARPVVTLLPQPAPEAPPSPAPPDGSSPPPGTSGP